MDDFQKLSPINDDGFEFDYDLSSPKRFQQNSELNTDPDHGSLAIAQASAKTPTPDQSAPHQLSDLQATPPIERHAEPASTSREAETSVEQPVRAQPGPLDGLQALPHSEYHQPDQPDQRTAQTGNPTQSCRLIENLLFPGHPVCPVFGSSVDLLRLNEAINISGLHFKVPDGNPGFHAQLSGAFADSLATSDRRRQLPDGYYATFLAFMENAGPVPQRRLSQWLQTTWNGSFSVQLGLVTGNRPDFLTRCSVIVSGSRTAESVVIWVYRWFQTGSSVAGKEVRYCGVASQEDQILGPLRTSTGRQKPEPTTPGPTPQRGTKRQRQGSEDVRPPQRKRTQQPRGLPIPSQPRKQAPNGLPNNDFIVDPPNLATSPTTDPRPPTPQLHRNVHDTTNPVSLSRRVLLDPALFALPHEFVSRNILLDLSTRYSNMEIFQRVNAARPEHERVRGMNVITKRKTTAVKGWAREVGVSVREVREELERVRELNGVVKGQGVRGNGVGLDEAEEEEEEEQEEGLEGDGVANGVAKGVEAGPSEQPVRGALIPIDLRIVNDGLGEDSRVESIATRSVLAAPQQDRDPAVLSGGQSQGNSNEYYPDIMQNMGWFMGCGGV